MNVFLKKIIFKFKYIYQIIKKIKIKKFVI